MEQDGKKVTCGAVLRDPELPGPLGFGLEVPAPLVKRWKEFGSDHVIAQAELLPLALAKFTWADRLKGAWVISFIDNDSVKAALVKGSTQAIASRELLSIVARIEIVNESVTWYSRVPSPSNCSDDLSRLIFEAFLSEAGAALTVVKWPEEILKLIR